MSNTLYRKVYWNDRMPNHDDRYMTDLGLQHYNAESQYWENDIPEYWLEPIQEPTEEEIGNKAKGIYTGWYTDYHEGIMHNSFIYGFKKCLELLKGEK